MNRENIQVLKLAEPEMGVDNKELTNIWQIIIIWTKIYPCMHISLIGEKQIDLTTPLKTT